MEREELEKLLESSDTVVMPRGLASEADDAEAGETAEPPPAEDD